VGFGLKRRIGYAMVYHADIRHNLKAIPKIQRTLANMLFALPAIAAPYT
jgi:hypothetical protein